MNKQKLIFNFYIKSWINCVLGNICLDKNSIYPHFLKKHFSTHSKSSFVTKYKKKGEKLPKEYIYGRAPVFASLCANNREKFYKLYVYGDCKKNDDILRMSRSMSIPIEFLKSKSLLNNYSCNRPHNGLVLEASPIRCFSISTHDELLSFHPHYYNNNLKISNNLYSESYINLWLFLDEITDPMNMGAILRNVCYFGLRGVILSAKNCAPLSPVVNKASSGACEFLKIFKTSNSLSFLRSLKTNNWKIVGAVSLSTKTINNLVIPYDKLYMYLPEFPTLLIMGSEGKGIRKLIMNECDLLVTIPSLQLSLSTIDSLNVSVASGILISELAKILKLRKKEFIKTGS
ncbi:hypothetical protein PORY_002129 [Pneumocystis oryctolagi]|uniref:Uncharacterized protein n=1 Tax=Pneumocystis oryctolagi TaxID=42067 RepID=A0ACB7C9M6_9ASCO|nr:hypothetical protein PORY_002129 [Pneumocystis oryctolagi]